MVRVTQTGFFSFLNCKKQNLGGTDKFIKYNAIPQNTLAFWAVTYSSTAIKVYKDFIEITDQQEYAFTPFALSSLSRVAYIGNSFE